MLEFIKKLLGGGSEAAIKKLDKTAQAVEALEDEYRKLTDEQQQLLNEAFYASQTMVNIVNDFLSVSRLQTGRFSIKPKLKQATA